MRIKVKADAKVGNVSVHKGHNEVADYIADVLRRAGLVIEEPVKKVEKKVAKKVVRKVSKKSKK